jgi:hypothetical protein
MTKRVQILCASMGLAFVVVLFAGLLVAHMLPPFSPDSSALETANWYRDHTNGIRFGMILMMFGAVMTAPFTAVIAAHIKQIEGDFTPLTYTFLALGAANIVAIFFPVFLFSAAAFRPERDPELLHLVNDMAWIPFIMNAPPAVFMSLVLGIAILADKRPVPAFPRWSAYANFWIAFLFLPACLLTFFKTGPFAWNGVLSFWLAAVVFGGWFVLMSVLLLRAAGRPVDGSVDSASHNSPAAVGVAG